MFILNYLEILDFSNFQIKRIVPPEDDSEAEVYISSFASFGDSSNMWVAALGGVGVRIYDNEKVRQTNEMIKIIFRGLDIRLLLPKLLIGLAKLL